MNRSMKRLVISVLAAVGAVPLARSVVTRWGGWNAVLVAAGAFVVLVAVAGAVLQRNSPLPSGLARDGPG